MNTNTYYVLETATVNGVPVELRRLDTGDATAYVVVATVNGNETYANFSSRKAAETVMENYRIYA